MDKVPRGACARSVQNITPKTACVQNGSSGNIRELLRSFASSRFVYVRRRAAGMGPALQMAFRVTSSTRDPQFKFFTFSDYIRRTLSVR